MRKFTKRLGTLLAALLLCLLPAAALAAEQIPIIDAHSLGVVNAHGVNIDGSVYVPLRSLFELTQAGVDYRSADRLITIKRVDGAVLTLHPGDKQAVISHLGEDKLLEMPAAARLIDGVTYVPLRFAAENLLCRVEWDNEAKRVELGYGFVSSSVEGDSDRYTIDFLSGRVYETPAGGTARLLGEVPGLGAAYADMPGWHYLWKMYQVERGDNGAYLISLHASPLDPPVTYYATLLLTAEGGLNRYYLQLEEQISPCLAGDDVWWPEGASKVLRLDAATGQTLAEYECAGYLDALPEALPGKFRFSFCDGEYMLFYYAMAMNETTAFPALVNLRTGEVTDLFPLLIPAAERADFTRRDWSSFASQLRFARAADGVLYFTYLRWEDNGVSLYEQELSYRYK